MALCVVQQPDQSLVVSTTRPCEGYYMVETQDLQGTLSATEVGILFSAGASLYALTFVFKLARRLLGF